MSTLLEVSDVRRSFGGLHALSGCSFTVERGSVTGLIGPNGSGKTTMFNVITGYEHADSGAVRFDGHDITGMPAGKVGGLGIGRTFQLSRVFGRLTLLENLRVGRAGVPRARRAELFSDQRCMELLDFVGLTRLALEPAGSLSYGQRKLVELAMVLAQEPSVILLDEPAGGINPTLIEQMADRIAQLNKRGVTFLLVEHNMEFVMGICDVVAVMERGAVISVGEPGTVRNDPRVLDAYLGGSLDDDPVAAVPPIAPGREGGRP